MVLQGKPCGRVGRRRKFLKPRILTDPGLFRFWANFRFHWRARLRSGKNGGRASRVERADRETGRIRGACGNPVAWRRVYLPEGGADPRSGDRRRCRPRQISLARSRRAIAGSGPRSVRVSLHRLPRLSSGDVGPGGRLAFHRREDGAEGEAVARTGSAGAALRPDSARTLIVRHCCVLREYDLPPEKKKKRSNTPKQACQEDFELCVQAVSLFL